MEEKEVRTHFIHGEECVQSHKFMQQCGEFRELQAFVPSGTQGSMGKQPKTDSILARSQILEDLMC